MSRRHLTRDRGRLAVLITAVVTLVASFVPSAAAQVHSTPSEEYGRANLQSQRVLEQDASQARALALLKREAPGTQIGFAGSRPSGDAIGRTGVPAMVRTSVRVPGGDAVERARAYLSTFGGLYRLDQPDDSCDRAGGCQHTALKVSSREIPFSNGRAGTPEVPLEAVRLQQTYGDVPVFGGEIVVYVSGEQVLGSLSSLSGNPIVDTMPAINERDAELSARRAIAAPKAPTRGVTTLTIFDPAVTSGGVQVADAPAEARLAWDVSIMAANTARVLIDAHTGAVLFVEERSEEHGAGGLANLDLQIGDAEGGNSHVSSTGCYLYPGTGPTIGTESGLASGWTNHADAKNAFNFGRAAYKFFHNTFGRHSIDDDDEQIEVFIRASWDGPGSARWVEDCDLMEFRNGAVQFDIVVHELTHGILHETSELIYKNQSGALNESYADTMAALADGNWTIGEERLGGPFRSLQDPPLFGQPDKMSIFVKTTSDHGGVHTNSGIPNKAHFLIAEGGSFNNKSVPGIGRAKMGRIAYAAMHGLSPDASFEHARFAEADFFPGMFATYGWFGFTSEDQCSARQAWAAVEIGPGDMDCDGATDDADNDADGDGVADAKDNCLGVLNPVQTDLDKDGIGDACDSDKDGDAVVDTSDNCPAAKNVDQKDTDTDGKGDACDDDDKDGVLDTKDNCLTVANYSQSDIDGDGKGDACDADIDGDGVPNEQDNCVHTKNPNQGNSDGDGYGDACDKYPGFDDDALSALSNKVKNWKVQSDFDRLVHLPVDPDEVMAGRVLQIRVSGLSSAARAIVVDNSGAAVAKTELPVTAPVSNAQTQQSEERLFQFRTDGDKQYALALQVPAEVPLGHDESFSVTLRAATTISRIGIERVARYAGADRAATAATVSSETFSPGIEIAYVATGDAFADALGAGPVAALNQAPILLTGRDSLHAATADELRRLTPSRIVVLGGTAAVSDAVASQLQQFTQGGVTRLAGPDRYSTAVAVTQSRFSTDANPKRPDVVHIATGEGFADALAGGAAATLLRGPVLLVRRDAVPAVVADELRRLRPGRIIVLGGRSAVSDDIVARLRQFAAVEVERVWGPDRYSTAVAVSAATFTDDVATVFVATGANYPDALAGVPAAGRANAPILLVDRAISDKFAAELDRLSPERIVVLGGHAAVSEQVKNELEAFVR